MSLTCQVTRKRQYRVKQSLRSNYSCAKLACYDWQETALQDGGLWISFPRYGGFSLPFGTIAGEASMSRKLAELATL
jgi:hypothetical protein